MLLLLIFMHFTIPQSNIAFSSFHLYPVTYSYILVCCLHTKMCKLKCNPIISVPLNRQL